MRVAAIYRREIKASLTRVWENVRDWEHLPFLHDESFSACLLEEEGDWGWRAVTKGTGKQGDRESVIELAIDLPNTRYVSRTLDGPLPGVEIWTQLEETGPHSTQIEVAFHLPHLDEAQAARAGQSLITLYTKLWDEDEAMMMARQTALDARPSGARTPMSLGSIEELKSRLPYLVETPQGPVRLIACQDRIRAYPATCPHLKAPLGEVEPDAENCITCPWHGYRFDIESGLSADGRGLKLGPMPRIEVDDNNQARLVWP